MDDWLHEGHLARFVVEIVSQLDLNTIKTEVAELLRQAEESDNSEVPDGLDIPAELARREERLEAIARDSSQRFPE